MAATKLIVVRLKSIVIGLFCGFSFTGMIIASPLWSTISFCEKWQMMKKQQLATLIAFCKILVMLLISTLCFAEPYTVTKLEEYDGKPSISNETFVQNSNFDRDEQIYNFADKPKANAGEFQYIKVGDYLLLDGTNSFTLGGTIVSWEWLLEYHGDPSLNKKATGDTPAITGLNAGIYTITLTVTDQNGQTDTDTVLLKVGDSSQSLSPPTNFHEEQIRP